MTPDNKIAAAMAAHLEAHPPHIEWTEGAGGIKHGVVIEEIPLPKPKPKKAPDLSVDDLIATGSLDTPEPGTMKARPPKPCDACKANCICAYPDDVDPAAHIGCPVHDHHSPEPRYMETLDEDERTGH